MWLEKVVKGLKRNLCRSVLKYYCKKSANKNCKTTFCYSCFGCANFSLPERDLIKNISDALNDLKNFRLQLVDAASTLFTFWVFNNTIIIINIIIIIIVLALVLYWSDFLQTNELLHITCRLYIEGRPPGSLIHSQEKNKNNIKS